MPDRNIEVRGLVELRELFNRENKALNKRGKRFLFDMGNFAKKKARENITARGLIWKGELQNGSTILDIIETIGAKLNEIKEKGRTNGEYLKIGMLYGFHILVKTEASMKDGFDFKENRFFVESEGGIKYTYTNGHVASDPKLASLNFLKALERIPKLIEQHKNYAEKAAVDLPILVEVVNSIWRKEDELKHLKSEKPDLPLY